MFPTHPSQQPDSLEVAEETCQRMLAQLSRGTGQKKSAEVYEDEKFMTNIANTCNLVYTYAGNPRKPPENVLIINVAGCQHCAGFQGTEERKSDMDKTYGLSSLLENPQGDLATQIHFVLS